jgi:hypothetical protein
VLWCLQHSSFVASLLHFPMSSLLYRWNLFRENFLYTCYPTYKLSVYLLTSDHWCMLRQTRVHRWLIPYASQQHSLLFDIDYFFNRQGTVPHRNAGGGKLITWHCCRCQFHLMTRHKHSTSSRSIKSEQRIKLCAADGCGRDRRTAADAIIAVSIVKACA